MEDDLTMMRRRKLRKGTFSCWECKRRKVRCHFASASSTVCQSCQRRHTTCVTQEYDDLNLSQTSSQVREHDRGSSRMTNGDGFISLSPLPDSMRTVSASCSVQVFNSVIVDGSNQMAEQHVTCTQMTGSRYDHIRQKLWSALPSQKTADSIIGNGYTSCFLQFFTLPYSDLFRGNLRSSSSLSKLPSASDHPVILARMLLYLAHGIQSLDPSGPVARALDFESPVTTMRRYVDVASALVTSKDLNTYSLEGLECLILEGTYYINAGDLRRAWLVFRRAIGTAQLMGLHRNHNLVFNRLDPASMASPSFMWYRVVHQDRSLAIVLDLPPSTSEDVIPIPDGLEQNCPSELLERFHSAIMGQLATRNGQKSANSGLAITQDIDVALRNAAQGLPPKWWLLPRVERDETMQAILRILVQITHFHLLILLHLPCMLRSDFETSHKYNKTTAVNASRELLSRYVRFRCMKQGAFCCRSIDFSAFTACLTILIAHLGGGNSQDADGLAHQRQSDRATIEEVVDLMLEVNQASNDNLLQQTASIVTRLSIEEDAACATSHASASQETTEYRLRVAFPYIGRVIISRYGIFAESVSQEIAAPTQCFDTLALPTRATDPTFTTGALIPEDSRQDTIASQQNNMLVTEGENVMLPLSETRDFLDTTQWSSLGFHGFNPAEALDREDLFNCW